MRQLPRKFALLLTGTMLGYLCALLTFREHVTVDTGSGRISTSYRVFPFECRREYQDRAFNVVFPLPDSGCSETVIRRNVFDLVLGSEVNYRGAVLVRAQNKLVEVVLRSTVTPEGRKEYATEFKRNVDSGGVGDAMGYADRVWERLTPSPDGVR